jgi:hypothetical protein
MCVADTQDFHHPLRCDFAFHTFFLSHNHNYSQNIGSLKKVDKLWWIFQLFVLGVLVCSGHGRSLRWWLYEWW